MWTEYYVIGCVEGDGTEGVGTRRLFMNMKVNSFRKPQEILIKYWIRNKMWNEEQEHLANRIVYS